jgi:hypothetical protein
MLQVISAVPVLWNKKRKGKEEKERKGHGSAMKFIEYFNEQRQPTTH